MANLPLTVQKSNDSSRVTEMKLMVNELEKLVQKMYVNKAADRKSM